MGQEQIVELLIAVLGVFLGYRIVKGVIGFTIKLGLVCLACLLAYRFL